LHGDVPQSRREKAYNSFKSGSLRCIVATNVAARGLDFPSVDLVIQMTPPNKT
jgi:superfamily II DNA/RNA helicase